MRITGSFRHSLLNRRTGEIMSKHYRQLCFHAFFAGILSLLEEMLRQMPVLTGASKTAVMHAAEGPLQYLARLDSHTANEWRTRLAKYGEDLAMTEAKTGPDMIPGPYNRASDKGSRERWKKSLEGGGQTKTSFVGDEIKDKMGKYFRPKELKADEDYIQILISTPWSNQWGGLIEAKIWLGGFFLQYYEEGSIDAHAGEPGIWGRYPYSAWQITKSGKRAYTKEFKVWLEEIRTIRSMEMFGGSMEHSQDINKFPSFLTVKAKGGPVL